MKLTLSFRIIRAFLLVKCVLVFAPAHALAQSPQPTISWISDSDGFWDVAANWKDNQGTPRVPTASDDVLIDRGAAKPVVTIRTSQSAHSISATAPLVVTAGASLAIAVASKVTAGVTLDNGLLSLTGPLTLSGASAWKTGTIIGAGGLMNAGTLTLSGTDTKFLGGVLNNSGTVVHQAGTMAFDPFINPNLFTGTLINTGLYDIQGDVAFTRSFLVGATITNSGTIRKSAGTGTALINIPFVNNAGTLDAESGTLAFSNGTHSGGGTFSAGVSGNTQAILQLSGNHVLTGTFKGSGKGVVQLNGSFFTAGSTGANLNLSAGLLQWVNGVIDGRTATWRNSGSMTVVQGGSRILLVGSLDNAGTFAMSGPSAMDIDGCGTFTNLVGSVFDFQGDGAIFDAGLFCGGAHNLVNNGTIRKSTGTLSTIAASGFNNTPAGAIDVRAGTLAFQNGHHTGGTFTVAAGATLDLTGGHNVTYSGTYTGSGAGVISLSNGILIGDSGTFNFPAGLCVWTGGIIGSNGASGLTNAGTITLSGAGQKFVGGVLNNTGSMLHQAGPMQMDAPVGSAVFVGTLNNSGLYDLQGDFSITRQFLDADVINNSGTFRKSGGTGSSQITAPFNNTGTLEVRSGPLTVFTAQIDRNPAVGNTLTGGTWHVFTNSNLSFVNPEIAGASTAAINNAVVILDGPGATFPGIAPLNNNMGSLSVLNGSTFITSGNLSNAGSLTLGAAAKLNVTGAYTQTAAGILAIQIAGRPPTGLFGQLASTGSATLAGTLNVATGPGFGFTAGDVYTVMSFPSHTGAFATTNATSLGLRSDLTATALKLTAGGTQIDLSPTSVTIVTPSVKPGQPVTVNYTVKNLGGGTATGDWFDSVYISASPFVGPAAVLLGTVHHTGDVAGQSSYNGSLSAPSPAVLPGAYSVLVVADSNNVLSDSNRDNNTLASTGTLAVTIPMLPVGAPVSDKIASGQDLYYHLVLTPGADIVLSASFAVVQQAELFVRFGALPTLTMFDLSTAGDLSNLNPKLAVNNAQGGDYFILVHSLAAAGAGQTFSLMATAAQFQVTSIFPQSGLNSGTQTIFVNGAQFTSQTTVSLVAADNTVFSPTSVVFNDSTSIAANFDLRPIPVASYAVSVVSGNQTAIAATLFRVTDVLVGSFASTVILSPAKVRVGSPIPVQVEIHGTLDALTPVPLVQVDATNVQSGQEHQQLVDPALPLFFQNELDMGVIFDPQPHAAGIMSDFNLSLISLIQIIDWDGQKDRLRPTDIPPDAWDAIWTNLRPRLKSTVGDFYSLLGQDAAALAANGVTTNRLNRLFQFEVAMANDQTPVPVVDAAVDVASPVPGLSLQFIRTFIGSSIAGRYHLGRLGRGWVDSLDVSATADPVTGIVTVQQGALTRRFVPNGDGSYSSTPPDFGRLTLLGGVFQLREKNGNLAVFHADGSLDFLQDTNGNRLTAGYSGGQLTTLTHSNGSAITLSYNAQGRIRQATDPLGRMATYLYDGTGQQLQSVTTPTGTVSYSYTAETTGPHAFALASITTTAGTHVFLDYDEHGRIQKAQRDGGAQVIQYSYDVPSARVTDADNRVVSLFYDDSGRVLRTIDALGRRQLVQFDDSGEPTALQPQGSGPTIFSYDSQGNLTSAADSLGAQITAAYDPTFNRLTSVTDALGHITSVGLDANGNPSSTTYLNGSREQYSYDAQGNPVRRVDRDGNVTTLIYDKRGLVLSMQLADGSRLDYGYDAHANLTSATDIHGAITMQYDSADRMTRITYPQGRSINYTYDSGGRVIQSVDQTGFTVNYTYNAVGRLSTVTDGKGATIVTYSYDPAGKLSLITRGNGSSTTFDYDAGGRMAHVVNLAPNNSVNSRFDYTYDQLDRRDSVTTLDGKTTYGYDTDDRLISVTLPSGRSITYVYDAAGNRIGATDRGVATAYTGNNLNEYLTIGTTSQSFDTGGNLLTSTGGGVSASYRYDSLNRLIGVTNGPDNYQYEYDALGHRAAVMHNGQRIEYLVDPGGNVVCEFNAGQLTAHDTYGLSLISRVDQSGSAAYYDFDAVGSTVGLTGPNGQYVNRYSYLPFGQALSVVEGIPNPFRFIGALGVQDDQNGLHFMRARFYSAAQGRFIQPDPIHLSIGSNLYTYASNNPISIVDPLGLAPILVPNPAQIAQIAEAVANSLSNWVRVAADQGVALTETQIDALAADLNANWTRAVVQGDALEAGLSAESSNVASVALADTQQVVLGDTLVDIGVAGTGGGAGVAGAATGIGTGAAAGFASLYALLGVELLVLAQQTTALEWWLWKGDLPECLPEKVLPKFLQTCGPTPIITSSPAGHTSTTQVQPQDPNYVAGPGGIGDNNFIQGNLRMPYIIGFENKPDATAPAQQVVITETLDPNLDLTTFKLGDIGFGNISIHVPDGQKSFKTRVDAGPSRGVLVDVSAQLSGPLVTWTFTSIDPATQKPPIDPEIGFLPPDLIPPNGEGFVTYSIRPFIGDASGTQIQAQASIVFDTNAPVATNVFTNTLATTPPVSKVSALPSSETTASFPLSWSGVDTGGPGIASFDIYVSIDSGPFQPFILSTQETSTTFKGQAGHKYGFYCIAHDLVGNVENAKSATETTTSVETAGPTIQCTGCYFLMSGVRATLAFNVSAIGTSSTFTYNFRTSTQTVQFSSTNTSQILVNGNVATFSGQGTLDGQIGFNFTVTATDGGGPGSGLDTVSIAIAGPNNSSYSANGTIVGGDIVVK